MIGRPTIRICLLATIPSLAIAMGALGQERTSGDVLTLDRAIELARANNRETKRAKFDIDRQREASAEAKTALYPRFDTYLLGTQQCPGGSTFLPTEFDRASH
jgi:outer membrane protein TolC